MDEKDGTALLGLALGIGLAFWAMGDGNIGLGLLAILVIVASVAWLGA
ncbi:MAG: hypothetical protein QOK35_2783 [Pseudonocardiales bacterium]|jgi:hypothetical protein|nr:hypothetical protein [Pseudonocardiales bacterium]